MLNYIWLTLLVLSLALAAWKDITLGNTQAMKAVTEAAIDSSKTAVTLSLGLIGVMSLWLGVMRLAEKGGLVEALGRVLRPVLSWLFPEVPAGHPALGAIVMNTAANMLGLANAATPLGLKAMEELQKLNPRKDTASNAMCTFLAINTSSVQLVPATAVALMAAAGAAQPTAIIGSALIATSISTLVGITAVKTLERLPVFRVSETRAEEKP